MHIPFRVTGESLNSRSEDVHHVYFAISVSPGSEGNAASVRRPGWGPISCGMVGQIDGVSTIGIHDEDVAQVPTGAGGRKDYSAPIWRPGWFAIQFWMIGEPLNA